MTIFLEPRYEQMVRDILKKYPYKFYIFGSRVKGRIKKFSDVDLCFSDDIPNRELINIEFDFEDSDLPYKVDIVNLNKVSSEFRKLIISHMVPL